LNAASLVKVLRNNHVESLHRGFISVVDNKGQIIFSTGNPHYVTFMRSAAKPFQVIPVIESGAADFFGFTDREISIMTSSHSGSEIHRTVVKQILKKIGLNESALRCGTHLPFDEATKNELIRENKDPSPLHNNCSGKHAAMLALSVYKNWDLNSYTEENHPVQQLMLSTISEITSYPKDKIITGQDGCGTPVFALPLQAIAFGYSQLVQPDKLPPKRRKACSRIVQAMIACPDMVAGGDRLCTQLMTAGNGKIVAKEGAEGVYGIGVRTKGWGIAIKIEDGSRRALRPVVYEILRQLDVLEAGELRKLKDYGGFLLKNHRDEIIGKLKPAFKLQSK